MKQLEELQKKVLLVINKNKELLDEVELLKMENDQLKEKQLQLESSLAKLSNGSISLEKEKDLIKNSIEELLESISSLETTDKDKIKHL